MVDPGEHQLAVVRAGDTEIGDWLVVGPLEVPARVTLAANYQKKTSEWVDDPWCSAAEVAYVAVNEPMTPSRDANITMTSGRIDAIDKYAAIRMDAGVCLRTLRFPKPIVPGSGAPDEFWCAKDGTCTPMFLGGASPQCGGQPCAWYSRLDLRRL